MADKKEQSYLFISRPKLAIVISLVIMLAGALLAMTLPLEEYPSITPPQVTVSASYPGASADVIETTIAAPVEAQLNGVENMLYMSSTSSNGGYSLTIYFKIGTDPAMAMINVQNRLQLVTPRLPEEVRRYGLQVRKAIGGPGILMIAVSSPDETYDDLYVSNYASIYVESELDRVQGVDNAVTFGSKDYSMRIWLDAAKMAGLGVTVQEVQSAVAQQNSQAALGNLGDNPTLDPQMIFITLRSKGRLKDAAEFEEIVVRAKPDGSKIKLKDVARIELGKESYAFESRINGKQATIISIKQLPGANAIDVANRVKKRMEEVSKSFPPGLEYHIEHDETTFVRESINEVIDAIILAVILVSLVTYLFLGTARAALIPFCAIPVSLIGVFIFMQAFGFSINLLILFALVLAVGLVVDDAIVVLENTQRHIQEGKDPRTAANITMKEVFGAILATSLVLMAVFVPVSFLGGITGQMYRQFAIAIASSIGLSAVVALTLSPALCAMILQSGEEKADFAFIQKFDDWFANVRTQYLEWVKVFVNNPKITMATFGAVIVVILFMLRIIPSGFLPTEDRGALFMMVQLPESATAYRTNTVTAEVEKEVQKIEGVKTTITLVGFSGENTSFVVARLKDWHERKGKKDSADAVIAEIRKRFANYPSATVAAFSPPAISGLGMFGGFEYQLLDKGDRSPQELYDEAIKLIVEANKDPALAQVYTSYTANSPQILLDVKVDQALAQNVEVSSIYSTMGSYMGTAYINDFNKFGRVYRVYMQGESAYREKPSDLSKIFVENRNGAQVPLLSVVESKEIVGANSISRYNMYRSALINGSGKTGISSGQAMTAMAKLSDKVLPKNMGFAWSGSSQQEQETSGQLGGVLVMSLIFVYLFLVALYESWLLPVSVMLISPVAMVGALFLQYVWGYALDLYAQIGLVMLIGLSTKQAILIIEFAKDAHENGMSVRDAAMEAAKLRFRAVMMTNIAFILGLLPLVFASGAGAASRHSIGTVVTGGMLAVAFIGTFLIPAFFTIVEEAKEWAGEKLVSYVKSRGK